MSSRGQVRLWHDEQGWGVIDSVETPGGCWTHFSSVLIDGYKSLAPGAEVEFEFEAADQDGYSFRASEAWPAGATPVRSTPSSDPSAFLSSLTITYDDDAVGD